MSTHIDGTLRDRLTPDFAEMLAGSPPVPDDPAALEHLAATLLVTLEASGMPADVPSAFLDAIEMRGDPDAAGLLAAIGLLAGEPVAAGARAAAQRLNEGGIVSPLAGRLGTLSVSEAVRIDGGDAELLVATLRRPRGRRAQVAILGIDHAESGGALAECVLTPPLPAAEARGFLTGEASLEGAPPGHPIAAQELAARSVAAARSAVEADVALDHEAAIALPLLARAFTGDPAGLARPRVTLPWQDDDPELLVDAAEDEDGSEAVMALLLDELEEFATASYAPDGAVWRHGDFVASTMLQWKGGYDDGRLGRWTAEDLAEYMLGYFPRKVTVEPETLADVPECIVALLRFLDDRGSLSGEPLEELEQACAAFSEEFHERASSPESWGLAKSMAMQMFTEGIDPTEPGAMEAWISDFNARPRTDRDAVLGGAAKRMQDAAKPGPGSHPQPASQRRTQRKAQRAARKRSRRRG